MPDYIVKIFLNSILAVIGFLLVFEFTKINGNIVDVQKELSSLKLEIVQIRSNLLTEDKVRTICKEEIFKFSNK